jgi:gluconolactonase
LAHHPSLTVLHTEAHHCINTDFEIERLKGDCSFSEGPVWNKEGFYLYSDIPQNVIEKIEPGKKSEVYLRQSGFTEGNKRLLSEQIGSNGLAYDREGNLLVCQHGNGAVVIYQHGVLKPFITAYKDRPFNSPNDIVAHPDGSIFFSDPPYGLKDQKLQPDDYQPLAGIYCWREGELHLISRHYNFPNGVCLSTDGNSLFTCSSKSFEAFVMEFDAATWVFKRKVTNENSDGIKCDRHGNIYLCTKEGIVIINQEGKRLATIKLDTVPANCCWGGAALNDLFITARQNIYLIRNLQKA